MEISSIFICTIFIVVKYISLSCNRKKESPFKITSMKSLPKVMDLCACVHADENNEY